MANQMGDDRHRTVFICDKIDYNEMDKYSKKLGYTVSVLLREAVYRLAQEIRDEGKIVLLRPPRDNEGHSTKK